MYLSLSIYIYIYIHNYNIGRERQSVPGAEVAPALNAYGRFPKFHRVFWAETLAH